MNEKRLEHLTAAEVQTVLEYIQDVDAIVVGGQSLAIWSRYYLRKVPQLALVYSMSSEDIDLYGRAGAAEAFAKKLSNARVYTPEFGDASPNAATVVGLLGDREIRVDFLRAVLGVDPKSIAKNFVTLSGPGQTDDKSVNILLLHPLDCLRSRFSNINDLKRTDAHSISSARASILILDAFIDDLLVGGEIKKAQAILMSLHYVIRDRCLGKTVHTKFNLDPRSIILNYRLDRRLDYRWRSHQLANSIKRLNAKAATFSTN